MEEIMKIVDEFVLRMDGITEHGFTLIMCMLFDEYHNKIDRNADSVMIARKVAEMVELINGMLGAYEEEKGSPDQGKIEKN